MWNFIGSIIAVALCIGFSFVIGRNIGAVLVRNITIRILDIVFQEKSIPLISKKILISKIDMYLTGMLPKGEIKKRLKEIPSEEPAIV